MTARTLFEKIWSDHHVAELDGGRHLIAVDRHVVHEVSSPQAFSGLAKAGRPVRHPELTFATSDHLVSTEEDRTDATVPGGEAMIRAMRSNAREHGIALFDLGDERQGIVHVIAPELAIALPGTTLACGDSHTSTVGALGTLAWGVGTSEVEHILATQCAILTKPRTMRVTFTGKAPTFVGAKDFILALIARIGTAGATGYVVEYAGEAISALSVEERMTVCNMSVEAGARMGLMAPDEKVFAYLKGRAYAPVGSAWDEAVAAWRVLPSDSGAAYDAEVTIDVTGLAPQVSWGTSPEQTISVEDTIPDPENIADPVARKAAERALAYVGLKPGDRLAGLPVQKVFIGSCTNSRLDDLRAAARMVVGRRVAEGVRALVVPGSGAVRAAAEREGLDRIFRDAGFEWRQAGCSMCAGLNADKVGAGERCIATSNRNFEGRQGPGSRTHLASPIMAAAAAVTGRIPDRRALQDLDA
jgi:3-isopropylmalate/(R)-2-methylmalate dehydratase large subunit